MNKRYILAITLAACLQMQAKAQQQNSFGPQQVITTQATDPISVYATDLDGDGDQDVLSASRFDDKIAWYENNGQGNFSPQQVITTQANGARDVYATDLDGDGDQDVLSASFFDGRIAWYENDGQGNFGEQQVITIQATGAYSVYATDLDGDGDQDVLSASEFNSKIAWYENDGQGSFGEQQIIAAQTELQPDAGATVYAADLDGDGDQDVLSASGFIRDDGYILNGEVVWYENDGQGNFSEQQLITTQVVSPQEVYAADLDGDGDQDVLSASFSDFKVAWYENDGQGNFGEQQVIENQAFGTRSVYATDLDQDGDQDVLSGFAGRGTEKLAWYENDGQGNFSEQQVITTQASFITSVYAADLDGDGDQDVLSASLDDDKIAWYENLLNEQAPTVIGFALINNNTDQALQSLQDGDVVSLDDLNATTFTVRADAASAGERIRRVEFSLTSPLGRVIRSEYSPPYSLFSDDRGDYFGRKAIAGEYTLTATPYYLNSTGEEITGISNTINFTFTGGSRPVVNSFTLVNNNTDEDVQPLENGDKISLDDLNSSTFTVRANVLPRQQRVRRVEFRLNAPAGQRGALRSEYAAPYSLFSDDRGDYFGREAYVGEYKLTATPYYLNSAEEEIAGTSETIRFTFTNSQSRLAASAGIAYPVPFNETLTLKLGTTDMSQTQIQLVHGYGQVYEMLANQVSQSEQGLVLNLAKLPSGPYTVRVITEGQLQTFRVSKE